MTTSSSFQDDPYGYVTNQCGHARIGAGVALLGLVIWSGWGAAIATGIVVVYFVVIEWWLQGLTLFWDSVEDAAHVGFGAAGVVGLHYLGPDYALGVFVAWVAILGLGYGRRL